MLKHKVLDVCCGSKMFYFDKNNSAVLYCDNRELETSLCDGRKLEIKPDRLCDFTNLPFQDNSFYNVIFDPPHILKGGKTSWIVKKYGKLQKDWKPEIQKGFSECFRVLKPFGTLIFKWSDIQIPCSEGTRTSTSV